jgi:Asp-tRNA(Asn)/Glu-tRNA(Gln) amidotransferase A subunit family amidase
MVSLALGTQTGGSLIRPAAYCGIYGIKPSFGIVNRVGVKLLSDSADTIGFYARSPADLALVLGAVSGNSALVRAAFGAVESANSAVRLAFCRTPQWTMAGSAMQQRYAAVEEATLARADCTTVELGQSFAGLDVAADIVTEFETWRSLAHERLHHAEGCTTDLLDVLELGRDHTFEQYVSAQKQIETARLRFDSLFSDFDCIITPSAPDEAPLGLNDTGPSTFNKVWSMLHVPCVNVPVGNGPGGLPLGFQVIAARYKDNVALAGAQKLRTVLDEING